jgi:uncharacterized membrane protein
LGAIGFQTLYYYPQLPPVVASHFDGAGRPNGWSSRVSFFMIYWGISGLMVFAFYGLPVLLRRLPVSLINVPNREYWLAPERRAESLDALAGQMHWFGNAALILIVITFQLAIRANLGWEFQSGAMWVVLLGFLTFVGAWISRLYRRFAKPN